MGDYVAEMQAEWVALGNDPEEFTVEKMAAIWQEQEKQDLMKQSAEGVSNLDRKMELMRAQREVRVRPRERPSWKVGGKARNRIVYSVRLLPTLPLAWKDDKSKETNGHCVTMTMLVQHSIASS